MSIVQPERPDQAERARAGLPAGQGAGHGPGVTVPAQPARSYPAGVRQRPSSSHGLPRRQVCTQTRSTAFKYRVTHKFANRFQNGLIKGLPYSFL